MVENVSFHTDIVTYIQQRTQWRTTPFHLWNTSKYQKKELYRVGLLPHDEQRTHHVAVVFIHPIVLMPTEVNVLEILENSVPETVNVDQDK